VISSLRLIKFSNTQWAVRRGWISYSYYSMAGYWWDKSRLQSWCILSESEAKETFNLMQGGEAQDAPKTVSISISNSDIGFWFVAGCVVLAIMKYLP
jgi:hypothetical protein